MNIDIGRSVTYPFEDQQWVKKVGILFLLGFIPGMNLIAWSGYAISIARNIVRGASRPLPEWSDWSDILVRGLLSLVGAFLYFSPALAVSCMVGVGAQFVAAPSSGASLTLIQCCASIFVLIYSVAASLLVNAAHVHFALSDQFRSYIEVGARFRDLQSHTSLLVMLFAVQTALSLIAAALSAILLVTCVAPIAIGTIAFLANGYILGSAAAAYISHGRRWQ
jgi:hypothetical protein